MVQFQAAAQTAAFTTLSLGCLYKGATDLKDALSSSSGDLKTDKNIQHLKASSQSVNSAKVAKSALWIVSGLACGYLAAQSSGVFQSNETQTAKPSSSTSTEGWSLGSLVDAATEALYNADQNWTGGKFNSAYQSVTSFYNSLVDTAIGFGMPESVGSWMKAHPNLVSTGVSAFTLAGSYFARTRKSSNSPQPPEGSSGGGGGGGGFAMAVLTAAQAIQLGIAEGAQVPQALVNFVQPQGSDGSVVVDKGAFEEFIKVGGVVQSSGDGGWTLTWNGMTLTSEAFCNGLTVEQREALSQHVKEHLQKQSGDDSAGGATGMKADLSTIPTPPPEPTMFSLSDGSKAYLSSVGISLEEVPQAIIGLFTHPITNAAGKVSFEKGRLETLRSMGTFSKVENNGVTEIVFTTGGKLYNFYHLTDAFEEHEENCASVNAIYEGLFEHFSTDKSLGALADLGTPASAATSSLSGAQQGSEGGDTPPALQAGGSDSSVTAAAPSSLSGAQEGSEGGEAGVQAGSELNPIHSEIVGLLSDLHETTDLSRLDPQKFSQLQRAFKGSSEYAANSAGDLTKVAEAFLARAFVGTDKEGQVFPSEFVGLLIGAAKAVDSDAAASAAELAKKEDAPPASPAGDSDNSGTAGLHEVNAVAAASAATSTLPGADEGSEVKKAVNPDAPDAAALKLIKDSAQAAAAAAKKQQADGSEGTAGISQPVTPPAPQTGPEGMIANPDAGTLEPAGPKPAPSAAASAAVGSNPQEESFDPEDALTVLVANVANSEALDPASLKGLASKVKKRDATQFAEAKAKNKDADEYVIKTTEGVMGLREWIDVSGFSAHPSFDITASSGDPQYQDQLDRFNNHIDALRAGVLDQIDEQQSVKEAAASDESVPGSSTASATSSSTASATSSSDEEDPESFINRLFDGDHAW